MGYGVGQKYKWFSLCYWLNPVGHTLAASHYVPLHFGVFLVLYRNMLTKTVKSKIVSAHQTHKTDTGSAPVQIGVLSRQIDELTAHLKHNPKDNHSRRGLLGMVNHRRKLLAYLSRKQPEVYAKLIKKLGLKK